MDREDLYRLGFRAAALYGLAWGTVVALFPALPFQALGMPPPNYPLLASAIGMMAAAYGYGLWMASADPRAHAELVGVGLLGKTLAALAWASNVWVGALPARTLWMDAPDAALWIPLFAAFLHWNRRTRFEELLARAGTG